MGLTPYYSAENLTLYQGDAREVLAEMEPESVQCVVTSPPYWSLRDYGVAGQLGLESTPEEYVDRLLEVFRAVKRVLRSDGTLWLNIGDCFSSGTGGDCKIGQKDETRAMARPQMAGLAPKQLVGIPWRLAFALQADGWWLRCDIIWHKPNPMPESVTDRPTKTHEYVFLLSKSESYFYDAKAIREPFSDERMGNPGSNGTRAYAPGDRHDVGRPMAWTKGAELGGRNRRSVWTIPTSPNPLGHFAIYPRALVEPCIKAGTSERGACPHCGKAWVRVTRAEGGSVGKGSWVDHAKDETNGKVGSNSRVHSGNDAKTYRVLDLGFRQACSCPAAEPVPCVCLDPFSGIGTTMFTAWELGRHGIGIELSEEYCRMTVDDRRPAQARMAMGESGEAENG